MPGPGLGTCDLHNLEYNLEVIISVNQTELATIMRKYTGHTLSN